MPLLNNLQYQHRNEMYNLQRGLVQSEDKKSYVLR